MKRVISFSLLVAFSLVLLFSCTNTVEKNERENNGEQEAFVKENCYRDIVIRLGGSEKRTIEPVELTNADLFVLELQNSVGANVASLEAKGGEEAIFKGVALGEYRVVAYGYKESEGSRVLLSKGSEEISVEPVEPKKDANGDYLIENESYIYPELEAEVRLNPISSGEGYSGAVYAGFSWEGYIKENEGSYLESVVTQYPLTVRLINVEDGTILASQSYSVENQINDRRVIFSLNIPVCDNLSTSFELWFTKDGEDYLLSQFDYQILRVYSGEVSMPSDNEALLIKDGVYNFGPIAPTLENVDGPELTLSYGDIKDKEILVTISSASLSDSFDLIKLSLYGDDDLASPIALGTINSAISYGDSITYCFTASSDSSYLTNATGVDEAAFSSHSGYVVVANGRRGDGREFNSVSSSIASYVYVRSVSIEGFDSSELSAGSSFLVKAILNDGETLQPTDRGVSWKSSDESVLSVEAIGDGAIARVTGKALGSATLTVIALSFDKSGSTVSYTTPNELSVVFAKMNPPELTLESSESSVLLTWDGVESAVGYKLYRYVDDELNCVIAVESSEYLDSALLSGNTYSYRISAVDINGNGEEASLSDRSIEFKVLAPTPSIISPTISSKTIAFDSDQAFEINSDSSNTIRASYVEGTAYYKWIVDGSTITDGVNVLTTWNRATENEDFEITLTTATPGIKRLGSNAHTLTLVLCDQTGRLYSQSIAFYVVDVLAKEVDILNESELLSYYAIGSTYKINARCYGYDDGGNRVASDRALPTFVSSDDSIAEVDQYGNVTVLSDGNYSIALIPPNGEEESVRSISATAYRVLTADKVVEMVLADLKSYLTSAADSFNATKNEGWVYSSAIVGEPMSYSENGVTVNRISYGGAVRKTLNDKRGTIVYPLFYTFSSSDGYEGMSISSASTLQYSAYDDSTAGFTGKEEFKALGPDGNNATLILLSEHSGLTITVAFNAVDVLDATGTIAVEVGGKAEAFSYSDLVAKGQILFEN